METLREIPRDLGLWLLLACLAALYGQVFPGLIQDWAGSSDFSHGFFIPLVTLWLLWIRRDEIREAEVAPKLAGALLVLVLAHSVSELALGLALVVALVRGVGARRDRPLRALVVEIALGAGGLCLARWLAVPGVLGVAASFWGYALVQSLYFLVPGGSGQRVANEDGDPFERARARLSALLEEL